MWENFAQRANVLSRGVGDKAKVEALKRVLQRVAKSEHASDQILKRVGRNRETCWTKPAGLIDM